MGAYLTMRNRIAILEEQVATLTRKLAAKRRPPVRDRRRGSTKVTIGDTTRTVAEWCALAGISVSAYQQRRRKHPQHVALTTPKGKLP